MLDSLRRFSALEPPAQTLFLRALLMLPLVALSLKFRGFDATRSTLRKGLSRTAQQMRTDSLDKQIALTAHMVNAADRHGPVHPSCLVKSLTLWWMLGRQGVPSELRVGVRKEGGSLEAHAWVEREGMALNEPEERHHHYAAFDASLASLPEEER
ncbi:MAG TPA: lasso peptide biosynthesis B2 protein [Candidatus Acidoferrum sp.]|nr:lasso peptide biosynthesis B2 protein [Candidatus Acidoferrum sp.]